MTRRDEAIAYAEEGRASHQSWAEYLDHCRICPACADKAPSPERLEREIGTLEDQLEWVRKYDVILGVLRSAE